VPHLAFTPNLARLLTVPEGAFAGATVREVLEAAFAIRPEVRGYVLDDQGALRKHVMVFVDGVQIRDRITLDDPVGPSGEVFVMQALSGG
jgi:molybdopterin synthase sulfur carrier subunit